MKQRITSTGLLFVIIIGIEALFLRSSDGYISALMSTAKLGLSHEKSTLLLIALSSAIPVVLCSISATLGHKPLTTVFGLIGIAISLASTILSLFYSFYYAIPHILTIPVCALMILSTGHNRKLGYIVLGIALITLALHLTLSSFSLKLRLVVGPSVNYRSLFFHYTHYTPRYNPFDSYSPVARLTTTGAHFLVPLSTALLHIGCALSVLLQKPFATDPQGIAAEQRIAQTISWPLLSRSDS